MDFVLHRQDCLGKVTVLGTIARFKFGDVGEVTKSVGDRTLGQWCAFERRYDANHIDNPALAFVALELLGFNAQDVELLRLKPEGLRSESPRCSGEPRVFISDWNTVDP